jgi:hypothetical protein
MKELLIELMDILPLGILILLMYFVSREEKQSKS